MDPEASARETIAADPAEVERWLAGQPGAWGRLAGQAVLRARARVGRRLTGVERRRIWAVLWHQLERQRGDPSLGERR